MNSLPTDIPHISGTQSTHGFFPKMVVISLLFHAICFVVAVSGNGTRRVIPSVTFIDLNMDDIVSRGPAKAAFSQPPADPANTDEKPLPKPVQPSTESEQLRERLQNAVRSSAENPDAIQKVSFGLGMMNGHFGTLSDGKSLRDDMREYYLSMLQTINEKWWVNGTRYEGIRGAIINVVIARNGEILDVRVIRSSGNPSYDRTMLTSLRAASPVPPLPDHFNGAFFTAPIRFNAPLNLLSGPTG